MRVNTNEKIIVSELFKDADGNAATIDGPARFSVIPPEAATVRAIDPTQPGEDGTFGANTAVFVPNRAWVEANNVNGVAAVQLQAEGDADRSDGVRLLVASAAVEFALPEATAAELVVGEPIHQ